MSQTTVRGDQWTRATVVAGAQVLVRIWFDQLPRANIPLLEIESNRTTRDGFFMGYQTYRVQFRNVIVAAPSKL